MKNYHYFILPAILFLLYTPLNSMMMYNESCAAYSCGCNGAPDGQTRSSQNQNIPKIGTLITEGGFYFLLSCSKFNTFLSIYERSEISGLNFLELQKELEDSIKNMEYAIDFYSQLCDVSERTPHNMAVIYKLMEFDYNEFREKRGLIKKVFSKVKFFLSRGKLNDLYHKTNRDCMEILLKLKSLRNDVDNKKMPVLFNVWRINQKFSEIKLFGQYTSEVFYRIK